MNPRKIQITLSPTPGTKALPLEVINMQNGELRFTFMTFVFSVTVGLVISTFGTGVVSVPHALLKFGYTFPALLLMVDMWNQYNKYHEGGKQNYGYRPLFLDTILLTLMYASLATLSSAPDPRAADVSQLYPPQAFWVWVLPYSVLKIIRCWRMVKNKGHCTWYSVLHIVLLVLILLGWGWQLNYIRIGLPFYWSGLIFSMIVLVYLLSVYTLKWDPLTPVLKNCNGAV